ncbi:hypothetical protein [Sphingomonas mollis]|uniref:Uncharacterized protein n=1 Tax=Sphingomonas mollis TaxID=2795726 RepID=A0ABS0XRV2_9SPHN|nr:hypothetical protein [Sphingomonas sp. BT553]MBJ6122520.1 hypothetical protein [Sphingomonas sp. BT553]
MHMTTMTALALAAAQLSAVGQTGVTTPAPATVKGSPATFDLAGFRLGMSEAEAERVLKERGMTVRRRTRAITFEDRVRQAVNLRGGRLPLKGGSVLNNADIDDGKGGRIMIRMLGWPDGARVRSITYIVRAGTEPAAWRTLLVGKYGPPSRDSGTIDGEGLHARWCGQAACLGEGGVFRLYADVNARGGTIALSQPEGTSSVVSDLVEREASKRGLGGKPAL